MGSGNGQQLLEPVHGCWVVVDPQVAPLLSARSECELRGGLLTTQVATDRTAGGQRLPEPLLQSQV